MAAPVTGAFQHLVVEIETTPGSGVYSKICGITSRGVNRTSNLSTTEVPGDCDDESVPSKIEKAVQSQEVTISGSGTWARQSHEVMLDWWYGGQTLNIRVQHVNAAVGDTEYESGPAILSQLNHQVEKGQKIQAEIQVEFDGVPTRTAKA
ncbi:phage tail tube protein [Sinorhizobium sp. BJ1]|uniref:phage tail tube protein n=1 Tax=Sinorhizobium sp. BJ1 TaxID=2035455 RepID=UPI000BE9A0EF|nr:phage tail tube protein [Sinorhizobium sp. BJ1]PDT79955.1 hypothetical protein CO676_30375 [Sinorhizobium sp. BJ1]